MGDPIKNMGASVRARLLKISKERGQTFNLVLTRYALERFLFRLSTSPHKNNFVLKGAMLVTLRGWTMPTGPHAMSTFWDLDRHKLMTYWRHAYALVSGERVTISCVTGR